MSPAQYELASLAINFALLLFVAGILFLKKKS